MSAQDKQARSLARQLFRISVVDGRISAEHVAGVLSWVEAKQPPHPVWVLKAYHDLVAAELARTHAVVGHAGPLADSALASIAAALSRSYGRPITASAAPEPGLIAGLRIRIGDDVYESSVSGQLAALAAST